MAKLITKFRYYKAGSGRKIGGYLRYISTRENVVKIDDSKKFHPATEAQKALICRLLSDFKDSKTMHEYEDYTANPTIGSASEFITRCLEDNAMQIDSVSTYADYIATRPRVEKLGSHGLFGDDDHEIVLSRLEKELNAYKGNVYTMIVSLRREDAARLGFDSAYRWRDLLRAHTQEMADAMNIPYTHLRWYAAFHDEGHHPHVHVMLWSDVPGEGYLSKKGVAAARSSLARDIFADDLQEIYTAQTAVRDELKTEWKSMLRTLIDSLGTGTEPHTEIEEMLIRLAVRLRGIKGKKVYGYLKSDVKDLVDAIVDKLIEDENAARLYDLWWEKKRESLGIYQVNIDREKPPLSANREFRSLKNDILRAAVQLGHTLNEDNSKGGGSGSASRRKKYKCGRKTQTVAASAVTGLLRSLAMLFQDDFGIDDGTPGHADRRLLREEDAKRNAEPTQSF